jgi:HTH-type transcriptional regulator / antitoxin HipB
MTTFTPHRLGQIIKAYRLEQKLTQAQLAAKSGTGLRFIVELERGKPTVQLGKVIAVADALGLMLMLQKDARVLAGVKVTQPADLNLMTLAKMPQSAKLAVSHTEIAPNVLESTKTTKRLHEAVKLRETELKAIHAQAREAQIAYTNAKPYFQQGTRSHIAHDLSKAREALDQYLQSDSLREYVEMKVREAELDIMARK